MALCKSSSSKTKNTATGIKPGAVFFYGTAQLLAAQKLKKALPSGSALLFCSRINI
ncbi:hypothetical protein [Phascolarctobacterium sp.]|uniref:hypothetical protein n=1 Tax=Phascolarctobacterium sp. TaxID=2049039 RepID=UPI0030DD7421